MTVSLTLYHVHMIVMCEFLSLCSTQATLSCIAFSECDVPYIVRKAKANSTAFQQNVWQFKCEYYMYIVVVPMHCVRKK